jgi:hypothetical protein
MPRIYYAVYNLTQKEEKANGTRTFKFFSKEEIEEIARENGLVQRQSPITGFKFLLNFTTGMLNVNDSTLAQMAAFLSGSCNAEVSPQAIDQKIKHAGKEFLKTCLIRALELSIKRLDIDNGLLSHLKHLFIIDSTNFDLHPKLKNVFKGNNGAASKSSIRIQFVYDFLSARMYIEIGDVNLSDAKTFHSIIKENKLKIDGPALFLSDLGYFKTDSFILINDLSHTFISRLKNNLNICNVHGEKLDITQLLTESSQINIKIKIGDLSCRLVGEKIPEKAINQRLRKANKEARKKGRVLSKEYKIFLRFSLFITNTQETFTFKKLFNLYRTRWQIELVFKTWKSILGIHKIRSARKERVLCEIYGKLIIAVLTNIIYWRIKLEYATTLSYHKLLQHVKTLAINWTTNIVNGNDCHLVFLEKLKLGIMRLCPKNKQRNKPHIESILDEHVSACEQTIYALAC